MQTTLQCEWSTTKGRPVHLQSGSNQWHTPAHLIELVREVFTGGVIDLDPCSNNEAQEVVQAKEFWTENNQNSSLTCAWMGRVFVNPPFGCDSGESTQARFLEKAVHEHGYGHCAEALLLLKAAVGYKWFATTYLLLTSTHMSFWPKELLLVDQVEVISSHPAVSILVAL